MRGDKRELKVDRARRQASSLLSTFSLLLSQGEALPQVGQCPAEAHNLSLPGATPGPAN